MNLKNKIIFAFLFISLIFSFSLVMSDQYKYTKIQKDDLTYVSEVYKSYKKNRNFYKLICESGNEYLITYILADDEHFDNIKSGDSIKLGINNKKVVELEVKDVMIISLEDCHQRYTKQFNTSLFIIPTFIVFIGLILLGINILIKKIQFSNKIILKVKVSETIDNNVYKKIQNSIYKDNGLLRCNILEQIESDDLIYTFYKAMLDYLNNNELVLFIDDGCLDDELAMIFYKNDSKLYFNQTFRNGNEPFEIEKTLFWYYPFDAKVTNEEQMLFNKAVDEYIMFNNKLLKIKK